MTTHRDDDARGNTRSSTPGVSGPDRRLGRRSVRIEVDERPRCTSLGDYLGDDVPCDQHAGHKGSHTWAKPLTGAEEFEWTNRRRAVRRVRMSTPGVKQIALEFQTEVVTAPDGEPAVRLLGDDEVIERMASEIKLLRDVLVFADGFVVSNTGSMTLADLYNDICDQAGVIKRAGCWPRGSFRKTAPSDDPKVRRG